ncbi:hypothetical protein BJ742DRAFT_898446 [Cladochytrium replicatum]|nr:hypothetical protein BJ742DRAFT_898446 [Cladochytrium replicatum]
MPPYPTHQVTAAFAIFSSVISVGTLLIRHVIIRPKMIAREMLVTSMLVSGLINSVNTMISGCIYLATGALPITGTVACSTSGFIRQWTMPALDYTLLVISLTTSSVLMQKTNSAGVMDAISKNIWYILAAIWGVSLGTAITAQTAVGYINSGTWCWIAGEPLPLATYMRFGLMHVPKMIIFVIMIVCYGILFRELHRRQKSIIRMFKRGESQRTSHGTSSSDEKSQNKTSLNPSVSKDQHHSQTSKLTCKSTSRKNDPLLRSMLLLAIYPIAFIILWAPMIVHRLYEAVGIVNPTMQFLTAFTFLHPGVNCIIWLVTQFLKGRQESHAQISEQGKRLASTTPNTVRQTRRASNGEVL